MTRAIPVIIVSAIVMARRVRFLRNMHIHIQSVVPKIACQDGKELSIGRGIRGIIPQTTFWGLSLHCGIPRFRILYIIKISIIRKNIRRASLLCISFFSKIPQIQSHTKTIIPQITTDSPRSCTTEAYSHHTSSLAQIRILVSRVRRKDVIKFYHRNKNAPEWDRSRI
jgi:hypothetical protein